MSWLSLPLPHHGFQLDDWRRLHRPLLASLLIHALLLAPTPGRLPAPASPAAHGSLRASLQAMPVAPPPPPAVARRPGAAAEPAAPRPATERRYPPQPAEAPPATSNEGIDLAGLRQYHLALGQQARQFRRYPPAARAAGWQGRVSLRLVVAESGAPLNLELLGSSSFPVLDQAALEMMGLAASHTEVPASLRGRSFSIDLAVDFNPAEAPP
ncbi:MAG: hypothetical protein H6R15_2025 [Proteobacteria bacterium]|nr:hypothetical protein [Pseudomonadota bacterium]